MINKSNFRKILFRSSRLNNMYIFVTAIVTLVVTLIKIKIMRVS